MSASELGLTNLIAIVDANGFQSDGPIINSTGYENLISMWSSFGWNVLTVDGNSMQDIYELFTNISSERKPTMVLARTIKGKGIDFMENNNQWHHSRLTKNNYENALAYLEDGK